MECITSWDKTNLLERNKLIKVIFNAINNNVCNSLIHDVEKSDRPEATHVIRVINHRNKHNKGIIDIPNAGQIQKTSFYMAANIFAFFLSHWL